MKRALVLLVQFVDVADRVSLVDEKPHCVAVPCLVIRYKLNN